jgi:hypothetical protein
VCLTAFCVNKSATHPPTYIKFSSKIIKTLKKKFSAVEQFDLLCPCIIKVFVLQYTCFAYRDLSGAIGSKQLIRQSGLNQPA